MSYALSASLQAAVYQRLLGDAELGGLVGTAIYDAPLPVGAAPVPEDYVTLGVERVRANDTFTSRGAVHDFVLAVHSGRDGFDRVKRIAAAVCECLVDAPLTLHDGWLVALRFLRASAERGPAPQKRRVALQFRAVVDQAD